MMSPARSSAHGDPDPSDGQGMPGGEQRRNRKQIPRPTAASGVRRRQGVLFLGEDMPQLVEGRRPGWTVGCLVDPTRQPDRIVGASERVHTVDENAGRASETGTFRFFGSVHDLAGDRQVRMLITKRVEVSVGDEPVGAVIEVQKRDVHTETLSLGARSSRRQATERIQLIHRFQAALDPADCGADQICRILMQ